MHTPHYNTHMHFIWKLDANLPRKLPLFILVCHSLKSRYMGIVQIILGILSSVKKAPFIVLTRVSVLEPSGLFLSILLITTLFSIERVFRSRIWCPRILTLNFSLMIKYVNMLISIVILFKLCFKLGHGIDRFVRLFGILF